MSFRGFTLLELVSITTPWVTPEHPDRDSAGLKNLRHDDLARIIYYCLRCHEVLLGDTP